MVTRDKILNTVSAMPSEFELDELIERLIFIQKVEEGLESINNGKGIPHEKVEQIFKEWQK